MSFVAQNFPTRGRTERRAAEHRGRGARHRGRPDRAAGTMEATDDIDTQGAWTEDDEEALLGLAAYRYVAATIGKTTEASWATSQYDSLLGATNAVLGQTISQNKLDYLPCSLLQPNTANRCGNPRTPTGRRPRFGSWAWEGSLLGATVDGPGLTLIDATYDYGFGRSSGVLPPGTTGGFPDDYYASAYDAEAGTSGLAGPAYRDQGIVDYEFMLANGQSGPRPGGRARAHPTPTRLGSATTPAAGQGSSPHAWGMAGANKVLLDSLVAERTDGDLVVGRGIPLSWLRPARDGLGHQLPDDRRPPRRGHDQDHRVRPHRLDR